jgi:hypothetical protein
MTKIIKIEKCRDCTWCGNYGMDTQTTSSYYACWHPARKEKKEIDGQLSQMTGNGILNDCPLEDL